MTIIINIKHRKPVVGKVAYCGLSPEYWASHFPQVGEMEDLSVLGKPRHLIIRGNRERTIENYRQWLWQNINREAIRVALYRIGSGEFDAIACWCKPLACHCDVILSAASWYFMKEDAEETWRSEKPLRDVEDGTALERHLDYLCMNDPPDSWERRCS